MLKLLAAFGGIKLWTPFADAKILQECIPWRQRLGRRSYLSHGTFPIQPKDRLYSELSPPHRTLLKGKLGGKMHASGETKRIGV